MLKFLIQQYFHVTYKYPPIYLKIFFFFWLHCMACEILILQPGNEPRSLTVNASSPNLWSASELPPLIYFNSCLDYLQYLIQCVRIKQAPWQTSGGQGRPKSPSQRGWVIAKEELRSSSARARTRPISVLPVAWFKLIRTRMKTPWESPRTWKSSQLVDPKEPLQPIRPCQLPVLVLTL